jgi:hypothetical protein
MEQRAAIRTMTETEVGAPDFTMLPAIIPPGAILFVLRGGEAVRCHSDFGNIEPGERVFCVRQLSGG